MITPFERAVGFVISHEGGYSNDSHDTGGETKYGISKAAYPNEDIKNLTVERAKELYFADYWQKCGCGSLPQPVGFILFDSAVNQGQPKAIRMLQWALRLKEDGIVGQETIRAAQRASIAELTTRLVARRAYQYALHPSVARYGPGWFQRLAECHQMAMSEK